MRIVCPDCAAAYEVPDGMLAARRPVRCARCGGEWLPAEEPAAAGVPMQPAVMEPPPTPLDVAGRAGATVLDRPAAEPAYDDLLEPHVEGASPPLPVPMRPSRRTATVVRLAWGGSLLLLVAIAWAAYTWRTSIMQAWPPSERIYAALGLA